ncbi:hypothetical protein VVAX_05004 [Variovorax paradoxus]|uniref:Tyr recombinase domain-containing protein n=2 Tax=Variovorax paradoxus TaxID=34073 RepID=A0A679JE90_VARPD|nr:hypothetical protein VVAX_05004 [Variovorax paradoxus]
MPHRPSAFNDFRNTISTWTVGNVSVADDDDQDRLGRFLAELDQRPAWKATFLEILGRTNNLVEAISGCHQPSQIQVPTATAIQAPVVAPAPAPSPYGSGPAPKNPMRFSAALDSFRDNALKNRTTVPRTTYDRHEFLQKVGQYVVGIDDRLDKDPWVHQIHTHHLTSFMDASAQRVGRQESKETRGSHGTVQTDEDAEAVKTLKPSSLLKRLSDLSSFFTWATQEVQAATENPVNGLEDRRRKLTQQANEEKAEYLPFQSHHLTTIFEPERYLMEGRFSDYFWTPLLGLHLGTRLKELVTMEMRLIGCEEGSGIWYMDVKPEFAKNKNSVRRLPIVQPLIDLGFLEYLQQMRELGAKNLFPHRDLTGKTAMRLPSKLCGDAFAKLLNVCGVVHPQLVFHSFRHTVISALQDGGTPLSTSMQIVGHQAQDHAVRTGLITREEARSVTLSTYTHADRPRMNVQFPLVPLKEALERCVQPPIDYRRLRIAADIVREHTLRQGKEFVSGWPKLRKGYAEEVRRRLAESRSDGHAS